jgi:hypothetical protein
VPKRRTGLWAAALIGGLLVFALAGGGAYFLVVMLRQGTP